MSEKERNFKRFPGISVRAFEHPADRAALTAMRKVPGFDVALRKLIGLLGERSLRTVYMASSVRVGADQFSDLHRMYLECVEILDVGEPPELFVSQTPFVNAGAVGSDEPFIVINSAALAMLEKDEVRFILGHELGHVLSDHVLYKTMLHLLLRLAVVRFGVPLGWVAIFAIIAALIEWDRKSELSADRAGLLCVQDQDATYAAFMKLSGGSQTDQMNLDAFIRQAEEYEQGGDRLDSVYKMLNLIGRRHPFPVLRLAELRKWAQKGDYTAILSGEYQRREDEDQARVYEEFKQSARTYRETWKESGDPLVKFLRDISQSARQKSRQWYRRVKDELNKER